jgi:hypothetical protein
MDTKEKLQKIRKLTGKLPRKPKRITMAFFFDDTKTFIENGEEKSFRHEDFQGNDLRGARSSSGAPTIKRVNIWYINRPIDDEEIEQMKEQSMKKTP